MCEFQDHLNPFVKEYASQNAPSNEQIYISSLKIIPKIGDKNAKLLAQKYKSKHVQSLLCSNWTVNS